MMLSVARSTLGSLCQWPAVPSEDTVKAMACQGGRPGYLLFGTVEGPGGFFALLYSDPVEALETLLDGEPVALYRARFWADRVDFVERLPYSGGLP